MCAPFADHPTLAALRKGLGAAATSRGLFLREFTKHIEATAAYCVHCGSPDSRVHRLRECPRSASWRTVFPALMRQWEELPEFTTAFGLFPEPDGWRKWQAWLDTFSLPHIPRCDSPDVQVLYTDGACLFPRHAVIRVASGAVLKALPDGTFQIVWHGILPGSCQTIFRAELLAVSCALSSARKAVVFTDSLSVCRIATRLLLQLRDGLSPVLPADNKDLWAYFLSVVRGMDLEGVRVRWIKGHVNYRTAVGMCKVHAWFNHWVDLAAKQSLCGHFTPLFQHVVKDFRFKLVTAKDLFSFQAGVALLFANDRDAPVVRQPVVVGSVSLVGLRSVLKFEHDIHPVVCHQGFARSLLNWMREIRWAPAADAGSLGQLQDTSWLELFWGYVHDTSALPAFLHYHEWVFRMTLLWSSQFHLSRRCSVLGSVLSMLSSRQVSRCLGPGTCPKSGPFAHSVRVLTVLGSMGVSSCRRWLCRTFLPNSLFRRVFRQCGCLHLISFQQRSTRSRNTRRRAHRSHTRA